ncbi:hypothetical protein [Microcoleus sp. PH2017_18_LLB_O_A]|uniref:hypothetical protein n=1 Tax=Microcoleus sp. PH2017_18_LLB_O_A TaxID=2798829 RepID=UPI001D496CCF|nr:hypothetical protein [Microcoleus sp. PH2017_18_LLB_O_A]MCC3519881.1 hypothetical protein [Microcoleus sp. PH2017_18_LLB_O_A]
MDIFSIVNCREPIGNTSLGRARSNGPQKLWHRPESLRKPVAGSPAHPTKVVAQARKPVAGSPAHPTKVVAI